MVTCRESRLTLRLSRALGLVSLFAVLALAAHARADERAPELTDSDVTSPQLAAPVAPPPLNTPFLQYGVAFTAEFVPSAGPMCPTARECILGSGGGIAARVGRRSAGPWYFGGAYELSKQDPNKLYRLATLQQLRGEARYYISTGRDTQPYGAFGAGFVGYGNEGSFDTYGPMAFLAIGIETQISRRTVVGIAIAYRAMFFRDFNDPLDETRRAGVAQIFGIDVSLEGRDPL
jgi:hypothetical protein